MHMHLKKLSPLFAALWCTLQVFSWRRSRQRASCILTQDGCVAPTQSPDTTYLTQLTTALIFSSLWNIVKGLLTRCHTTTALSPLAPTPKETTQTNMAVQPLT
ncbi:uncharacterized protein LOC124124546 isoform X2 [Haliotis rufescens]|uniref:uncharacterized protein LOC124124546 isoform X2 n=1 Tax=Haliotis rufescens TaxID=6454 RepID=UPI00201E8CCB|nr:uncharacterized protein LOC124124546 isoform X2 [Haliotis rufescens]